MASPISFQIVEFHIGFGGDILTMPSARTKGSGMVSVPILIAERRCVCAPNIYRRRLLAGKAIGFGARLAIFTLQRKVCSGGLAC